MSPGFVAAVIEGFEGTLDAVLERLADAELRREIEALRKQLATKRQRIKDRGEIA
ncbi:MAG: hypothetical protein L0219_09405 [Phycisphaerales bacterium]|nr:hypothetical protein [Phycisphaerales bacterium]